MTELRANLTARIRRVGAILMRRLWNEEPGYRYSRRLRQALVTPVMVLAGTIWGILSAPPDGSPLGWAAGGALGFSLAAYLHLHLQPAVYHLGERKVPGFGWLASLAWDWVVLAGVVYLLTDVAGMPVFPAVTSAVLIGGSCALLLASFFDEGGSRFLGGFFGGGWGRPRAPFSHVETLLARGDHEGACDALRVFVAEHPGDARGWITLGRLLATTGGRPAEALHVLRAGLERATLTPREADRYREEIDGLARRVGEGPAAGREAPR